MSRCECIDLQKGSTNLEQEFKPWQLPLASMPNGPLGSKKAPCSLHVPVSLRLMSWTSVQPSWMEQM